MLLRFLIICFLIVGQSLSFAQELADGISASDKNTHFLKASELYKQGRYEAVSAELKLVENKLKASNDEENLALLYYWQGIISNRLNEFPEAVIYFDKAIKSGYKSEDINYELGQALFASDSLKRARAQFAKSYKRKYKKAVSLYYIAYISKELRDSKKAYKYFNTIEKLPEPERNEVLQAARMQVADMYLARAEEHPDQFRVIENHVIPKYESALEVDKKSTLAPMIREKIVSLQKKYDLMYFQMRNGRPLIRPPYFFKISQELGQDTNVIFNPNETTVSRSKQDSTFTRTDIFGRYTFYHHDYFSISPELRFNNIYYFNRIPEIYRNDSRIYSAALRNAYEYDSMGRPASILFDVDYIEVHRDIRQKKSLQYNSSAITYMTGLRLNFWDRGETIARLRYRTFDSFSDFTDSKTISASVEQVVSFTQDTLLLYTSLDRTRVDFDFFDTNSFTVRADYIISRFRDIVVPIIGVGVTRVDPIRDRPGRGIETLVNPSVRLIKTLGKNWRGILKYDTQKYDSGDPFAFAYKKSVYSFELEYLF